VYLLLPSLALGGKEYINLTSLRFIAGSIGLANALHVTSGDTAYWKFADPVHRAYALRDGSPAIDSGVVIPGRVESFQGTAPDLGAYEHGETPWVAGADWQEQPWAYPPPAIAATAGSALAMRGHSAPIVRMTAGSIQIRFATRERFHVEVFDARGVLVVQAVARGDAVALPLARHAAGMCMVRVTNGSHSWVSRVPMSR